MGTSLGLHDIEDYVEVGQVSSHVYETKLFLFN